MSSETKTPSPTHVTSTMTKDTQTTSKATSAGKKTPKVPSMSKITPSSTIRVGVWDLQSQEFNEYEPPENTESLFNGNPGESVIGGDGRRLIAKKHYMPGGKYRAIVKLFLRFSGQDEGASWAMATGWLIEKDLLVTAGHCAFDHSHKYGRLTHVKAYIGYSGKDTAKDKTEVQLRMGVRVATTDAWLNRGATDSRGDVAFIKVNKPFTDVAPIRYFPTPLSGNNMRVGVVGYPGDLMKKGTKEKGALMYEMYLPTNYTLTGSKSKMLQYTIDTYGGNSGSPVLRQSDMASIGVHVLGGNPNSASVIAGKYGNSFDALKTAIKLQSTPSKGTAKGIRWVSVPNRSGAMTTQDVDAVVTKSKPRSPPSKATEFTEAADPDEASHFKQLPYSKTHNSVLQQQVVDELKKALKKARDVTTDPLGAISAYSLHVAGHSIRKLCRQEASDGGEGAETTADGADADMEAKQREDAEADNEADEAGDEAGDEAAEQDEATGDETGSDEANMEESAVPAYDGVAERALLSEAAFNVLVQLGPEKCTKLGYWSYIQRYVQKYGHACGRAGTLIFPHLMAAFLRSTVAKLNTRAAPTETEASTDFNSPAITVEDANASLGFAPRLEDNKEAIIAALTESIAEALDGTAVAEVNDIVSRGLRLTGPILAQVAKTDLTELVESAAESSLEAAIDDKNAPEYLYDAMAQRALIGEAMLEAVLSKAPEEQVEEGVFGSIAKAVKATGKIGGQIGTWVTIGTTAYQVGQAVYDAARRKGKGKKEVEGGEGTGESGGSEEGGVGGAESANDWEAFLG